MAKPRSRKRLQHTGIAATPLRRSRRIALRKPFRFNDLPPELRNAVYSLVSKSVLMVHLTDKLPAPAKALSQVSRSVRAESLSIHYSVNRFTVSLLYWSTSREAQQAVSRIEQWHALFGKLAAPHIRSLAIIHARISTMLESTFFQVSADTFDVPRIPHWDAFFDEYRASFLARISRHSNHFHWGRDTLDDMPLAKIYKKVFPVGIVQSRGELRLKPEALQLLLTGLQLVFPFTMQSDTSLMSAALLSQLDENTG
jgi:hypothetical protein